jgi:hypothetical protein
VAIAWVDRNRRFFITTTCGLGEGEMIQRKRFRQLDKSGRAPPDKVIIEVAQPKAIAKYYKGAGTIDRHNRLREHPIRHDDHNIIFHRRSGGCGCHLVILGGSASRSCPTLLRIDPHT